LFTFKGGDVKSNELITMATDKLGTDKSMDVCTFKKKFYDEFVGTKLTNYKKSMLPSENYDFKMLVNEHCLPNHFGTGGLKNRMETLVTIKVSIVLCPIL
jgi:hypothetical protein